MKINTLQIDTFFCRTAK